MANNNANNSKIIASTSLMAFTKAHGPKMQVGTFANRETGEEFRSCIFTNGNGELTFCAFSKNLGVLTPAKIKAQRQDLQVVTLESGHNVLCKQGSTWDDVDLFD